MSSNLSKLANHLGHSFKTPEVLSLALRHSSLSIEGPEGSNQRYEFLGDRVLDLIVAEMLLSRFPEEAEGDIAKRHTALVRQETLVRVANTVNLGEFIDMSEGEDASGGRENASVLSDCCEAVIAALYIDGGIEVARDFIKTHWLDLIEETPEPPKDAKTTLQEWAQARGLALPEYIEINREGPAHNPVFIIEARVQGYEGVTASGSSKRNAEQDAAANLMEALKKL